MRVEEVNDRTKFVHLQSEWDALVGGVSDQIFYRHLFIRTWVDNFAPAARLRILSWLDERGELVMERFTGGPELEARLEEGFWLEGSGWKGRRGTSIAQDADTRGFYRELARSAADDGGLSLYFLRLGGRAVAFHYGLM